MQRPTGVTIIAVLAAIGGVFALIAGLALVGIGGAAAAGGAAVGGLATIVGLLLLVYGVVALILAYGFWTLKPWAWTLGVGLEAAGIVINILQYINNSANALGTVVSIAIAGVVLWYLFQPHVKAAFGRT